VLQAFWVIVTLVGLLLFYNARQVILQYSIDKNKVKIFVYMGPLILLGYVLLHFSMIVFTFVQTSQELDAAGGESVPRYYQAPHRSLQPTSEDNTNS